jgi:hypothetical protein
VVLSDLSDQGVADEDVVDQFIAPPIFAAEALGFGDARGQIPQPLPVAVVGLVEAEASARMRSLDTRRPIERLPGRTSQVL